jgi:hypothetical protein
VTADPGADQTPPHQGFASRAQDWLVSADRDAGTGIRQSLADRDNYGLQDWVQERIGNELIADPKRTPQAPMNSGGNGSWARWPATARR